VTVHPRVVSGDPSAGVVCVVPAPAPLTLAAMRSGTGCNTRHAHVRVMNAWGVVQTQAVDQAPRMSIWIWM